MLDDPRRTPRGCHVMTEPTDLERTVARAIGCEIGQDYDTLAALLRKEPSQVKGEVIAAAGQIRRLERMARAAIAAIRASHD